MDARQAAALVPRGLADAIMLSDIPIECFVPAEPARQRLSKVIQRRPGAR
jgi:hypothetical protein